MNRILVFGLVFLTSAFFSACGGGGVPVDGGRYLITSLGSGMVLDVPESSHESGKQIIQWPLKDSSNPSPNQVWRLAKLANGDNQWRIFSELNGLCLDLARASHEDLAKIVQWGNNGLGQSNQIWAFVKDSGGYRIRSLESGKDLTVFGLMSRAGAPIVQYQSLEQSKNQIFKLVVVD